MSHEMLRPFIVKVSVLGYFPLYTIIYRRLLLESKKGYKRLIIEQNH